MNLNRSINFCFQVNISMKYQSIHLNSDRKGGPIEQKKNKKKPLMDIFLLNST